MHQGKEDFEGGDHEYQGLSQLTGGNSKFKDFIEKELIPYINQTYRTSNERALVGHSQAGLFTTWMMMEHPRKTHPDDLESLKSDILPPHVLSLG